MQPSLYVCACVIGEDAWIKFYVYASMYRCVCMQRVYMYVHVFIGVYAWISLYVYASMYSVSARIEFICMCMCL